MAGYAFKHFLNVPYIYTTPSSRIRARFEERERGRERAVASFSPSPFLPSRHHGHETIKTSKRGSDCFTERPVFSHHRSLPPPRLPRPPPPSSVHPHRLLHNPEWERRCLPATLHFARIPPFLRPIGIAENNFIPARPVALPRID